MDIDTRTAVARFMVDVRLFHQTPCRYGQQSIQNEQVKYTRYKVHQAGRRVINATLVPIVVSSTGAIGPTARSFLEGLERTGRRRDRSASALMGAGIGEGQAAQHAPGGQPGRSRVGGRGHRRSLCDLVSLLGVYLAAELQIRAYAPAANSLTHAGRRADAAEPQRDPNPRARTQRPASTSPSPTRGRSGTRARRSASVEPRSASGGSGRGALLPFLRPLARGAGGRGRGRAGASLT